MIIRKTYETTIPEGKVVDTKTTSDNDAYSCNYINNKMEWKLLYSEKKKADGNLPLPSDFNELYVETQIKDSAAANNDSFINYSIPKACLSSTEKMFRKGYYFNSTVNGSTHVIATLTYIRLQDSYGSSKALNTYSLMNVWYR